MLDLSLRTTRSIEKAIFPFYSFVAPEAGKAAPQRVWVENAAHFKALAAHDANRPYLFRALSQEVKPLLTFSFKQTSTTGQLMYADNSPRLVHHTPAECKPHFEKDKATLRAIGRFLRRTISAEQRQEFAFHIRKTLGITEVRPDLPDYNPATMTIAGQPVWQTPGSENTTLPFRMLRRVMRGELYLHRRWKNSHQDRVGMRARWRCKPSN